MLFIENLKNLLQYYYIIHSKELYLRITNITNIKICHRNSLRNLLNAKNNIIINILYILNSYFYRLYRYKVKLFFIKFSIIYNVMSPFHF